MTEQDIQNSIRIELGKRGIPCLRLNSGKAWQGVMVGGVIRNPRPIELCKEGTSDLLAILPDGKVAWLECKTAKGSQREAQKRFQATVEKLGHKYYLCRSVEDIDKIFEK